MKSVTIRKGIFGLLLIEAVLISPVMVVSIAILSRTYTGLIYDETAEVLNLHTMIINSRMSDMEKLSFEILSNPDIQRNFVKHDIAATSYESYAASRGLYSQLFALWAMDTRLLSIGFLFEDGDLVGTDARGGTGIPGETYTALRAAARTADGKCGWAANAAGDMTVVLYRLIKDISGSGFRPLGVLFICIDARQLLAYPSVVPQERKPDMVCIAGDQILSAVPVDIRRDELEGALRDPSPYEIVRYAGEATFVAVRQSVSSGWYYLYMLPAGTLLRPITGLSIVIALSMLVLLAGVVAVGYRFARAISAPIARLAETAKVVAEGDYSVTLDAAARGGRVAISEVTLLSDDFSRMVRKIDHLINEVYAEKLLSVEMKYRILQQQINPHFLYNTLDTINWKALQGGSGEIAAMVRSLSRMLRGSITGPDEISVGEDLRFVEDYMLIQRLRFEERLDFAASIQPEVLRCGIPRVTLQPIVENCVIHNIEKYSRACEIRIHSSVTPECARICVDDNGLGIDPRRMDLIFSGQAEATGGSIGLRNINERIRMLFGERFGVRVENREPMGTRVTVTLPLKECAHEHAADRR
jgi:two-component system, sensor histidine kinase YesM